MKAYKLVEKVTRKGTNWCLYKYDWSDEKQKFLRSLTKQGFGYLFPAYRKNTIIVASTKTAGIICFKNPEDAKKFKKFHYPKLQNCKIIEVEGIGNIALNPKLIVGAGSLRNFIKDINKYDLYKNVVYPMDFISFPAVKVLE